MPEQTPDTTTTVEPAHEHGASGEHVAADAGHAASGHADGHDGHGPFNIGAAMLHHNMPYPAWEPVHGKPLITFDLGTHAAMAYEHLSHEPAFLTADGSKHLEWAREVAARKDFRYADGLEPESLAKAMAVSESHSLVVFPKALSWVNQQIFFGSIALVLLFLVVGVFCRRKADQLKPASRVQNALEAITLNFRDTVVEPNFHGHGSAWTPFFVSIFLMILSVNLMGLIPGTGTLSGNIGVTGGFASAILLMMLFFGMKEQGPKFWINLVPIHFTWAMSPIWLLLLLIELLSLVIKPFALAVRLFANMFAGHTVLLVFLSLGYVIIAQAPQSSGLAAGLGITGFLLSIGFYAMEILVAFIQAYVFTMLSAMFIGSSIHPEH